MGKSSLTSRSEASSTERACSLSRRAREFSSSAFMRRMLSKYSSLSLRTTSSFLKRAGGSSRPTSSATPAPCSPCSCCTESPSREGSSLDGFSSHRWCSSLLNAFLPSAHGRRGYPFFACRCFLRVCYCFCSFSSSTILGVLSCIVGSPLGTSRVCRTLLLLLGVLVERLREGVGRSQEGLLLTLNLLDIVAGEGLSGVL